MLFQDTKCLDCTQEWIDKPKALSLDIYKETSAELNGCQPKAFRFHNEYKEEKRIRIHITRNDIVDQEKRTRNGKGCSSSLKHCSCILVSVQKITDKNEGKEFNFKEKDVVYNSVWQTMIGRAVLDVDLGKDNQYIHGFYLVMLKKPKSFCQSKDFEISIDGDNDENLSKRVSELMYDSSSISLNINLIEIENSLLIDSIIVLGVYAIISIIFIALTKLIKTAIIGRVVVPENYQPFSLLLSCFSSIHKTEASSEISSSSIHIISYDENRIDNSFQKQPSLTHQYQSSDDDLSLDLHLGYNSLASNAQGFYIELLDSSEDRLSENVAQNDFKDLNLMNLYNSSTVKRTKKNNNDIKKALGIDERIEIDVTPNPTESYLRECRRQNSCKLRDTSSFHWKSMFSKTFDMKNRMYFWILILCGTFYTLPSIQLTLGTQRITEQTGSLDICYYNYLCRISSNYFQDYANVFSNVSYIFCGVIYILLVYIRRERRRKAMIEINYKQKRPSRCFNEKVWKELNAKFTGKSIEHLNQCGIPEQYGIYFGLGVALIFEGILSMCYHICPTEESYQFDTTFMYIILVLVVTKVYQFRHPDITLNSHKLFSIIAVILTFESIGYYTKDEVFIIIFIASYLIMAFGIISKFYFQKSLSEMIKDCWAIVRGANDNGIGRKDTIRRLKYGSKGRLVFFGFMIVLNLSLACYFAYNMTTTHQAKVSRRILVILGINTMVYVFYYVIMKNYYVVYFKRTNECLTWTCWMYIILFLLTICPALYFYLDRKDQTLISPSESRHLNGECILGIFDSHDMWHFLTSSGVLFAFMAVLTIEDNNTSTPWNQIPVF